MAEHRLSPRQALARMMAVITWLILLLSTGVPTYRYLADLGEMTPPGSGHCPEGCDRGRPARADRQHDGAGSGNRRSRRDRPEIPRALLGTDLHQAGKLFAYLCYHPCPLLVDQVGLFRGVYR